MVGTLQASTSSPTALAEVCADIGTVACVADPSLIDVPMHLHEFEELAAAGGRQFVKDRRKIEDLLQRTLSTVRQYKAHIAQQTRDISDLQRQRDRVGFATALSPMDAVQFLADGQKQTLFRRSCNQQ